MQLGAHSTQTPSITDRPIQFPWLTVDDSDEDAVWVRVSGGAAGHRSEELWNALEAALEQAVLGRAVVIDLTGVSAFDVSTIATLSIISRQAMRWHLDVRAVVEPASPLAQYVHGSGLDQALSMHSTSDAVRASLQAGIEPDLSTRVGSALAEWHFQASIAGDPTTAFTAEHATRAAGGTTSATGQELFGDVAEARAPRRLPTDVRLT